VKAAIVLDGVVPETPARSIAAAVLLLAAGREEWSDGEQRLWKTLSGQRFALNLRGAEHLTPTDLVWLAKGAIRTGTMGQDKTIAAIRDYIAAFLDVSLREEPANLLLTGPSRDYPEVEVTTREQLLINRK
jgi:hypothetical protein